MASTVSISQISFEHHRSALGIGETEPHISWRFEGDLLQGDSFHWIQKSYELEINRGNNTKTFSKESPESLFIEWPDEPLESTESASVRVRVQPENGRATTPWSDWVTVETGLLSSENWAGAVPIAADRASEAGKPKQPIYFRKDFDVEGAIKSARLYITALGVYEAEINGKRVGDAYFAAGWQSYNYRHVYNTYDVTDLIQKGENAIGATAGEGWYSGRLFSDRDNWGNTVGLLALLRVTLGNGTVVEVPTDSSWKSNTGPIQASEIYDGETYDSRLEADIKGWSSPSFDSGKWLSTTELPALKGALVAPDGPPIREIQEVKPQSIFKSPSGKTLIDFGQNLVGWLRLTVKGSSGTNITLKHAEVLENGELALEPLRTAKVTDHLILHGDGEQTWQPHFTYHGFRFAQVEGWPEDDTPLSADSITAVVLSSDMEQTGWFSCSHDLLNKFHENVRWSMKGNFFGAPTDCPQRDERLGWTGDAHAFNPTSNFLYNTAGFWRGWHRDVWFEMQRQNSMVVPFFVPTFPTDNIDKPATYWGDVTVGNAWNLYRFFGDLSLLREMYPQARAWIDKGIPRASNQLWDQSGPQFGDWLDPKSPPESPGDATTHKYLVADAYLVQMNEVLSQISGALGETKLAQEYKSKAKGLRCQFQKSWMTADGQMANETQTAYALALEFDLYTKDSQKTAAAEKLRSIIKENNYLVGTGFAGTPALGPALSKIDSEEYFYSMLLQTQVPSWLYQVVQNGTTTWERWDSLMANGSINAGSMTSFNHYAFGAVADWIHRVIGGLAPGEAGWKVADIAPVPGGGITTGQARYISGYGEFKTEWKIIQSDGKDYFKLAVSVPPNAKARVTMPVSGEVTEIGSGSHEFGEWMKQ